MSPPHIKRTYLIVLGVFVVALQCQATSIVVIVSGSNIVVASDSKKYWDDGALHADQAQTHDKVVVLNDGAIIGATGVGGGDFTDGVNRVHWSTTDFMQGVKDSLSANASIPVIESRVIDKLEPYMKTFSGYAADASVKEKLSLAGFLVEFIVFGYENGIPIVDRVFIGFDRNSGKLTGPSVDTIYPKKNRPVDTHAYMRPFGESAAIGAAISEASSPERKAALDLPGFTQWLTPSPTPRTLEQLIGAATDMIRLEIKFCPEDVGPPINLVVLSRKGKPEISSLPK